MTCTCGTVPGRPHDAYCDLYTKRVPVLMDDHQPETRNAHDFLASQESLLIEILAELKRSNSASREGAVSSAQIESNSKGHNLSVKAYAGSVASVAVDDALEQYGRLFRETQARALEGWQATVGSLEEAKRVDAELRAAVGAKQRDGSES